MPEGSLRQLESLLTLVYTAPMRCGDVADEAGRAQGTGEFHRQRQAVSWTKARRKNRLEGIKASQLATPNSSSERLGGHVWNDEVVAPDLMGYANDIIDCLHSHLWAAR
jgi:hypothetical protein